MDAEKKMKEILELGTGYGLIREMQNLSVQAESDDTVLKLLMDMAVPCLDMSFWKKNGIFCSTILSAIAHTKKTKSMSYLLKFIHKLPEDTALGVVDLISGLMPVYGKIISGPVKEMSSNSENSVTQAIGIQTLCKMALEGTLERDDEDFLLETISRFRDDVYLTSHIVDLAKSSISSKRKTEESMDTFLDGLLVEY